MIRQLKAGSTDAFDEIYSRYAGHLLRFSLQYTKVMEDAEEIVQDVFLALWNKRENIRREDSLRALLFIMAKHHLINAYRVRVNAPVYEDFIQARNDTAAGEAHSRLEYGDFLRHVRKALDTLPPTQRRVVALARLQGLSNKEVADKLQLSEQTVKNQLSIALKALRAYMGKHKLFFWMLLFVN